MAKTGEGPGARSRLPLRLGSNRRRKRRSEVRVGSEVSGMAVESRPARITGMTCRLSALAGGGFTRKLTHFASFSVEVSYLVLSTITDHTSGLFTLRFLASRKIQEI